MRKAKEKKSDAMKRLPATYDCEALCLTSGDGPSEAEIPLARARPCVYNVET